MEIHDVDLECSKRQKKQKLTRKDKKKTKSKTKETGHSKIFTRIIGIYTAKDQ